ncbi:hypothetical protein A6R68_17223, partial [Neotoma lepida]
MKECMDPRGTATNMRAFTMALILCDTSGYRIPVWKPYLRQLQHKFQLSGWPAVTFYQRERPHLGRRTHNLKKNQHADNIQLPRKRHRTELLKIRAVRHK